MVMNVICVDGENRKIEAKAGETSAFHPFGPEDDNLWAEKGNNPEHRVLPSLSEDPSAPPKGVTRRKKRISACG
jgi:hypothetical protein